jgi:hypothetical protein
MGDGRIQGKNPGAVAGTSARQGFIS